MQCQLAFSPLVNSTLGLLAVTTRQAGPAMPVERAQTVPIEGAPWPIPAHSRARRRAGFVLAW